MGNVNTIKMLAEFFTLSISWSMILFSPIASSELTGHGLTRLLSNLAIGSLLISMIIGAASSVDLWLGLKGLALLALALNTSLHKDKKTPAMWGLYFLLSLLLPFILIFQHEHTLSGAVFILLSSMFLGLITYSMTLGHWYLVVPKLSEAPLKKAAVLTWILLLIKIIWSSYSLINNLDFFEEQTILGAGYAFNWTLLLMRISFGYVVIAGMSYFNWKLLKLRSIQSSTGIMYAMTFFVFIGEMVSTYLFYKYGLYI